MNNDIYNTLLLIDKPKGITSFDIIRQLRKKYPKIKAGHAGTLDPMASGLMILATGTETRSLQNFIKLPKVYRAEILFGRATDTYDTEGTVTETGILEKDVSFQDVENALEKMVGKQNYQVPVYSAVKIKGKPLYAYARKGEEPPEIPVRTMEVFSATLLDFYHRNDGTAVAVVRFHVASGVFIRSLAYALGKYFQIPSLLVALRRISIGNYHVRDAVVVDKL